MIEQVLEDMAAATDLRAIILRYFNPIGSDPDLESGIYAKEPSHVLGQLVMAARGQKDAFTITGTEHPTRDGTGIRDYIHVWDLARAHVRAVERFDEVLAEPRARRASSSTSAPARASPSASWSRRSSGSSGAPVPVTEAPPRPGDAVGAFANVDRSRELLELADRAVARRGDRLRAGLGRTATRGPGVRVTCLLRRSPGRSRSALASRCGPRLAGRLRPPTTSGSTSGRTRRGPSMPLGGRIVVIDPGHQLGNHNFPRQINRLGAGRRVQEAVQHDRYGDQRRLPGGDVHLAGRAGCCAPARARSAPTRPD